LLIDWSESFGGIGPSPQSVIREESAKEMLEKNGFVLKESMPAGNHHYGLIFVKA